MQRNHARVPSLAKLAANQVPFTLFTANNVVMRKNLAPKFVQHVIDADWAIVEGLLAKGPMLMFEMVDAEDVNDPRLPAGSRVSGLGYACIMRDRYTLKICKSAMAGFEQEQQEQYKRIVQSFAIEDNIPTHAETIAEDGYAAFMALVEQWLTDDVSHTVGDLRAYLLDQAHQLSEQERIYCLQPYYWACEAYLTLHRRWLNDDPLVNHTKLETFLQKIDGFAKRHLLPSHMRKQMQAHQEADGRYRWAEDAGFGEANYPTDCRVRDWRKAGGVYIDPDSDANPADICGESYSLIRGRRRVCELEECAPQAVCSRIDLGAFRHLDVVRRSDFIREQQDLGVDLDASKRPQ